LVAGRRHHAKDCGGHQFYGWCLVPDTVVTATTASFTKSRHSCGDENHCLTFGAVWLRAWRAIGGEEKASATSHLTRQPTAANQTAPDLPKLLSTRQLAPALPRRTGDERGVCKTKTGRETVANRRTKLTVLSHTKRYGPCTEGGIALAFFFLKN
jgi:hypothetical protein